ncbi:hypothetical protein V5T82_06860 [Magnetovibrio sp. PR-2]|uniref:NifB/NifX family molybdenum-iron cluster-binding protein n=1 Tax=Magnetovibrio sp. PR-2 TaxID=3120356 RepID=UPI002FCE11BB
MKIAVASKNFETVTGHAGKNRRWLVFEVQDGELHLPPAQVELEKPQVFHHFKDDGPHPLDGIEGLIAASSGDSFLRRMEKRGVKAIMTRESDPEVAVRALLKEQLPPPKPRPITGLICKAHDAFSKH